MKKIVILYSLALSAFLVGCGGGSSSSDETLKDGYFIDAAVKGLHYHSKSGADGTTDDKGHFKYRAGDSVTFSIGNVILGEAHPQSDGLMTPHDLSNGDKEVESLMLRTLQSLDENHNPSDGIVIPRSVHDELSKIPKKEHFSHFKKDEDLRGFNKVFNPITEVTEQKAKDHFDHSFANWRDDHPTVHQKQEETHQETQDLHKKVQDGKHTGNEVEDIMDDMYKNRK